MVTQLEEANEVILKLGDGVADTIEQVLKGNWTDDMGHPVRMNAKIMQMAFALDAATTYCSKHNVKKT